MANSTPFPFPKRWTRRIRSAIVHTLALAQATLTVARGRAANRWNSLLRHKTDNDRLREEVRDSRRKEAFVFIHGYNVAFDDAIYRTAQIAYDLSFDGPPILYSWPSRASW